jgi:hypothetical protein
VEGSGGEREGMGGAGGEMAQTMYAHMNKWINEQQKIKPGVKVHASHPSTQRAGGVGQMVECLPSKSAALSSKPQACQKKKKKKSSTQEAKAGGREAPGQSGLNSKFKSSLDYLARSCLK